MNLDQLRGRVDKARGRIEKLAGRLVGSRPLTKRGSENFARGTAVAGFGDAREAVLRRSASARFERLGAR